MDFSEETRRRIHRTFYTTLRMALGPIIGAGFTLWVLHEPTYNVVTYASS